MSCGQASMKLPIFACEEFGVHVVKYMQKVRAAKTWRARRDVTLCTDEPHEVAL